jgi:DNA-binding XRE family transcriptional regulator
MLRGVRLDGNFLRRQRAQNGMSQKMLAEAAGISERTVRNAEKGMVVEVHIASYLSTLFDVPLGDMVVERLQEQRSKWLEKWARKFSRAFVSSWNGGPCDDMLALMHPSVEWRCNTMPKLDIDGSFAGVSAIIEWLSHRHCQKNSELLEIRNEKTEGIEGEGDILYFVLSADWVINPGEAHQAWITFLCRFEDNLVIKIEQFNGLSR